MLCSSGALHLWEREGNSPTGSWVPRPALSGHYGDVVDIAWMARDTCLMSVSVDQTARVATQVGDRWCEIARPQVLQT